MMKRKADLWLAKWVPWWRRWFNSREQALAAQDNLHFGTSYVRTDQWGRTIRVKLEQVYRR